MSRASCSSCCSRSLTTFCSSSSSMVSTIELNDEASAPNWSRVRTRMRCDRSSAWTRLVPSNSSWIDPVIDRARLTPITKATVWMTRNRLPMISSMISSSCPNDMPPPMACASVMRRYRCTRLGWICSPSLQLLPGLPARDVEEVDPRQRVRRGVDAHLAALRHGARVGARWTHAREPAEPDARLLTDHAGRRIVERQVDDDGATCVSAVPIHDTLRTIRRAPAAAPASSLTGTTTADGPWRSNHSGIDDGAVP